jgi:hypothetical protein
MRLHAVDWILSGITVALGLALLAAPVALTPGLSALYTLHGSLRDASALSRLMLSPWLPPLMVAVPMAAAIYCTVTAMRPTRRKVILVVALLLVLAAAALFVRGLIAPIFSAASGGH